MKLGTLSRKLGLLAIAAAMIALTPFLLSISAQAQDPPQTMLEQRGTLRPLQHEYTFSGKKGQTVTVTMASDAFDTYIALMDKSDREIATNDDFARTLNSTIVVALPKDGMYKVLTRSFSGQGGDYTVTVKPATDYDKAYARGVNLYMEGKLPEAVTAYSEAIQLEPSQPIAYLDRGDVYYAQGNLEKLIADYQKAAELYDRAGDRDNAQMVREQIQYVQDSPTGQASVIPSSEAAESPAESP